VSDDRPLVHVARFSELSPNTTLFIDTVIPGYAREIWSIIGANVGEDRGERPPIPADGFHLAILSAEPGNGSALHTHTTVEVFVPLSGSWQVFHGTEGEHEVVLGQWDVCSVPPGVWRGFRNVGDASAHLLVVVGGTDAGRLTWAPAVLAEAEARGMRLDEAGYMAGEE
jgi:mannose-6-phosphate isomerase-like protein (cupin superfamily)